MNLPRGEVSIIKADLAEIEQIQSIIRYSVIKSHYWNIYGKHYLTIAHNYDGGFSGWGYSLSHSIDAIEEITGLKIIKENNFNYISGFSWEIFDIKEKSGEIKPIYVNNSGGHSCYNIEDIKKCLCHCIICGCVDIKQETIYDSRVCSKCSKEIDETIIESQSRKEQECLNQEQFQKCRKLMGKSRKALHKGDLNACKLLSKEFKQVATLRL